MQLIFARSGAVPGPISDDSLISLYRHPLPAEPGRVCLRTNFVSTLDGSISGADGRSGSINTASDHHLFAVHRALADAIVVGAGTVRAERYRAVDLSSWQRELRAREGLADDPTLVIVTRSGRIAPNVAVAADGSASPVAILTARTGDPRSLAALREVGVEIIQQPGDEVDLRRATAELAEHGLSRLLCEGGPRLHRDLLAADLVDEVSLTVSPMLVGGDGKRSTRGPWLADPRHFRLQHALHTDDETLFTLYRRV